MGLDNEENIIKESKKDLSKFRPLYDFYYLPIFYYVYKRVSNREEADEITALVFLKALENISNYQFKGLPFSSWLYRIAHNTIIDMYRKNKTTRVVDVSTKQIQSIAVEISEPYNDELVQQLIKSFDKLSEEEVYLLELRFFEERRFKEIAEILDVTEESLRVKLHRLLKKIKTMLTVNEML